MSIRTFTGILFVRRTAIGDNHIFFLLRAKCANLDLKPSWLNPLITSLLWHVLPQILNALMLSEKKQNYILEGIPKIAGLFTLRDVPIIAYMLNLVGGLLAIKGLPPAQ